MAELSPYPARFDVGRLFVDASRVFAQAWAPIALGVVVLGVAPVAVSAMPWWRMPPDTTPDAYRRIWALVNLAKALVTIIGYSAAAVYTVAVSLAVLTGKTWREMFQARRLAIGFVTSLCVNLLGNWATFTAILLAAASPYQALLLGIAGQLSAVALTTCIGIAASAALAEQLLVGAAFVRSFRLLRGLRLRMVGLGLGYLLLQGLVQYGFAVALSLASLSYRSPGPARAVISITPVLVGAVTTTLFVSFFLQARRVADGPTPGELHEVFA